MFGFLGMMDNYEQRAISRTETVEPNGNSIIIDTCFVTDSGEFTCETAIERDGGGFVVVQCYKSREEAEFSHINWVKLAERGSIPDDVRDVGENACAKLARMFESPALPDGNIVDMEE